MIAQLHNGKLMSETIKSHSVRNTLTEWLSYLENIHSQEIDLGLSRIAKVAQRLSVNLQGSTVITVAGTNGKGTTCAFLENALLAQGKSCAVYSSPHIERFNERLRINRQEINDQPLIEAFEAIERARADITLTYYEYTTLAAFLILMEEQPDIIILEVGLGGRLDATNLIDADIGVITTIDLDHQAFLGDTRELIAIEKAGILRANKPAVIGVIDPPTTLLDHTNALKTDSYYRDVDFCVNSATDSSWQWQFEKYCFTALKQTHIPQDNVATALAVLALLAQPLSLLLDQAFINEVIDQTKVAGRTEKFHQNCDIILDVGHNPQAARYLASQLTKMSYTKVHAVLGMLTDKDARHTIEPLLPYVQQWYLGSLAVPRGCSAEMLASNFVAEHKHVNCFDNVSQAFKMAQQNAESSDLILVFGSFYTVAEIRRLFV